MNIQELLEHNIRESIACKQALLDDQAACAQVERAASLILRSYRAGGRLYIAGNGGSAADAQHLATEFVSRLARDRDPLPAEALTTDSSVLTAIGNDYGFDQVFARQLRAKLKPLDVFLGISTSGRSPNVIQSLSVCRKLSVPCILMTGAADEAVGSLADCCIRVPSRRTSSIQESHIVLAHTLCEWVESAIFPVSP